MKQVQSTYQIPLPLKIVHETFSDLKSFAMLHHLIISALPIESSSNDFTITEKPLKYLPLKIKYYVNVNYSDSKVNYLITGIPFCKTYMSFDFESITLNETHLTSVIKIEGKLIGKRLLINKMKKAQGKLINSLISFNQS